MSLKHNEYHMSAITCLVNQRHQLFEVHYTYKTPLESYAEVHNIPVPLSAH